MNKMNSLLSTTLSWMLVIGSMASIEAMGAGEESSLPSSSQAGSFFHNLHEAFMNNGFSRRAQTPLEDATDLGNNFIDDDAEPREIKETQTSRLQSLPELPVIFPSTNSSQASSSRDDAERVTVTTDQQLIESVVEAPDIRGDTRLRHAIQGMEENKIIDLLNQGANPDRPNKNGETPFHLALTREDLSFDIFNRLLEKSKNVNTANNEGETYLHFAAKSKNFSSKRMIVALLDKGADRNATDKKLRTPLGVAQTRNKIVLTPASPALPSVATPAPQSQSLPVVAVTSPSTSSSQAASSSRDDAERAAAPNQQLIEDFHTAIWNGKPLDIDRNLVNARNERTGNTALHVALQGARDEVIQALIEEHEANVSDVNPINGNTPLHEALRNRKDRGIIDILITRGARPDIPNKEGQTPLHVMMHKKFKFEDIKTISLILDKHKKNNGLNVRDRKDGDTPLHLAAKHLHEIYFSNLLEMLIEKQVEVDLNVRNLRSGNKTVLDLISDRHDCLRPTKTEILNTLIKSGAKRGSALPAVATPTPQIQSLPVVAVRLPSTGSSQEERSAMAQELIEDFHEIIKDGEYWRIREFVDSGVDVNAPNSKTGKNALHLAIILHNDAVIQKLIKYKVDVNIRNDRGEPPLHLALENDIKNDTNIINMLLNAPNADPNILNNEGQNALHIEVLRSLKFRDNANTDTLKMLLEKCKGVNAGDNISGDTVSHLAARHLNRSLLPRFLNVLIENGADLTVLNNQGQNVFDVIMSRDDIYSEIQQQLVNDLTEKVNQRSSQLPSTPSVAIQDPRSYPTRGSQAAS